MSPSMERLCIGAAGREALADPPGKKCKIKCRLFIYSSRRRVVFILGSPSIQQKQTLRPFSRELFSIVLLEHESLLGLIFLWLEKKRGRSVSQNLLSKNIFLMQLQQGMKNRTQDQFSLSNKHILFSVFHTFILEK